jgi:hypothetical protein
VFFDRLKVLMMLVAEGAKIRVLSLGTQWLSVIAGGDD